jgi:hypothetical protein
LKVFGDQRLKLKRTRASRFHASSKGVNVVSHRRVNMKTFEKLKETLAEHKGELMERFKVEKIGIFGSYVQCVHVYLALQKCLIR